MILRFFDVRLPNTRAIAIEDRSSHIARDVKKDLIMLTRVNREDSEAYESANIFIDLMFPKPSESHFEEIFWSIDNLPEAKHPAASHAIVFLFEEHLRKLIEAAQQIKWGTSFSGDKLGRVEKNVNCYLEEVFAQTYLFMITALKSFDPQDTNWMSELRSIAKRKNCYDVLHKDFLNLHLHLYKTIWPFEEHYTQALRERESRYEEPLTLEDHFSVALNPTPLKKTIITLLPFLYSKLPLLPNSVVPTCFGQLAGIPKR